MIQAAPNHIRQVVFLAFDGAQLLDVAGPMDVFEIATRELKAANRPTGYATKVVAPDNVQVRCSNGLRLIVDGVLPDLPGKIDTLFITGGVNAQAVSERAEVRASLARASARARRVASVCTGAWLLASAGLLRGRRMTTHWSVCEQFVTAYPDAIVEPDAIFVEDGPVWTSAGITSGIDLALAMVEADHGRELALTVARILVVYLKRPGGQSQFSAPLMAQVAERDAIRLVQLQAIAEPGDDHSIEALAARARMSARNFARVFARETGTTPRDFVENVRIDAARRLLEEANLPAEQIAKRCGFGEPDTMRRAFLRRLGLTPHDYRARFRSSSGVGHRSETA